MTNTDKPHVEPSSLHPQEKAVIFNRPGALTINWEDIPGLITDLRRAYNNRPVKQSDADGTVAAVLLQGHVATSPGDFS